MNTKICVISDCYGIHYGKGFCRRHYMEDYNSQLPECSIDGCQKRSATAGLCNAHYQSKAKHGDPLAVERRREERRTKRKEVLSLPCAVTGCNRTRVLREWCDPHYQKWLRHGDPTVGVELLFSAGMPCLVEECDRLSKVRGYCTMHYTRRYRETRPGWMAALCMERRLKTDENIDRQLIFEVYNGHCYLCGEEIDPDSSWHLEHIQPISKGGIHAHHNVAPSHGACNNEKWSFTLMEFLTKKGLCPYEPVFT